MVMRVKAPIETNAGTRELEGPIGYSGMYMEEFDRLTTEWKDRGNLLEAFSILFQIDYKLLLTCTDEKLSVLIPKALTFLNGLDLYKLPVPAFIEVNGHKIEIPKNLRKLSVGQAMILRQRMDTQPKEQLITYATAVYLQPLYFNNLPDSDQVEMLEAVLKRCTVIEIFPIGYFFLRRLSNYGNPLLNLFRVMKVVGMMKTMQLIRLQGLKALMILPI